MWNALVIEPMVNGLLSLYFLLGSNFVLALTVFTVVIRLAMLPLSLRQQRAAMKTQVMQPEIQAIQKKYRDNPQKMQEEFKKIGYNPAETVMGCLPLLIQFPIFIGLYRAIFIMLGSTPQSVFELTQFVYGGVASWVNLAELLPISNQFWWMNMAQPDPYLILPVLVAATMYLQQKLTTPSQPKGGNQDNPMAGMTQSMLYTMPLMFGFFSLTFPAGLSIYFVLSNLIGIGQGLIIMRSRENLQSLLPVKVGRPASESEDKDGDDQESEAADEASTAKVKQAASATQKNGSKPKTGRPSRRRVSKRKRRARR